ncbi:MAG: helix-hairpin-helix domain-containing protein [Saprospiraceae bacterium]
MNTGTNAQSFPKGDSSDFSQYGIIEDLIQSYIESRAEDGDFDYNTFMDKLEYFQEHPLNPNNLSDLEDFILLRPSQLASLKSYITLYGPIISIYELQAVPEFDINTIKLIGPFISLVGNLDQYKMTIPEMISKSKHQFFFRTGKTLEPQAGYDKTGKSGYLGSPQRIYFRYRQSFENKFSLGLTGEKDPGETFFSGKNKLGFDYYSFHVSVRKINKLIEDVVIGDYNISFGQGLLIHSGFGVGKSPWATNIRKSQRTVRAYTSVNESGYFRGVAANLNIFRDFDITVFGSIRHLDGNIIADSLKRDEFFSSFQESGYHRTVSEIADEKSLKETSIGASSRYHFKEGHIGLNVMNTQYDKSLIKADFPYNYYALKGNHLFQWSLDHSYKIRNFSFFGEAAASNPGSYAWLEGLQLSLDKKADIAILYRHLDQAYPALFSNAFSENTLASNETGLYIGTEIRASPRWKIGAYWDIWKHPWLRFGVQGPSIGNEQLIRITYSIRRRLEAYVQFRNKEREENSSVKNPLHPLSVQVKKSGRAHFIYLWSKAIETRTRIEFSDYTKGTFKSKGWMMYQDLLYHPIESPCFFTTRIAYYNTDDYNSGIYAYENDLLYNFYVPNYNGTGWRFYFNLRYDLLRPLTVEARYAITALNNANTIGSGLDLITGVHRSEIKFQIRYSF